MRLLIIAGGSHPYEESTPVLERFLKNGAHEVNIEWDTKVLSDDNEMSKYDALVFNTLRDKDTALNHAEKTGMKNFIKQGKGFVCIHISGCVSAVEREITGGGWDRDVSFHPPFGSFTVNVINSQHPGVLGVSDFVTNDELYMGIEYSDDNDVFMTADSEQGTHDWKGEAMFMPAETFPLGWTRKYGDGRVFVTLLGHNGFSFETQEFQQIILNGVDWVTD